MYFCIKVSLNMSKKGIVDFVRNHKQLVVIITAALLLELLSGTQYYYTHRMLERELEKRAETELRFKAVLIKSTLNASEDLLKSHKYDINLHLSKPDSMFEVTRRLVYGSRYVGGGFVAFVPYHFPSKGRLFEAYTRRDEEGPMMTQIASNKHDYTKRDYYRKALSIDKPFWSDPYMDQEGARGMVTSYVTTIHDRRDSIVAVAGIDVHLNWLDDTLNAHHIYPSSFILLLNEQGAIISKPRERGTQEANLINDSTVQRNKSRSGRSVVIRFNNDGRKGTIFYANMRGIPHWQIAVACYDDEVYETLYSLRLILMLLMLMAFSVLLYMIRSFVRTERNLHLADIEREKIGSELRIASRIQQAMIEISDKSYSIRDDLTLCGSLDPAKEVGGDFYCAFVRNEKLFFCIGDVSGKGVPSAIIMAVAHALFKSIAQKEDNPSHIMNALNTSGCQNNKTNIFTTMFVGVLDLPTGHLRYCNAGHEIPLIIKKEDGKCTISRLDVMPNLPIGLFDDFKYVMQKKAISHGTTLFLYTDGLTEARNLQHEQFGMSRLEELLTKLNTNDPQQLINGVKEAVEQFTEGAEQSDDLTILTFHYAPKEEEYLFTDDLTLQNDVREVAQLNSFVKGAMEQLGIEKPFARKLQLAVEEAVVNVIDYAYPAGKVGNINVKVTSNGHQLRFIITDEGIAFNPTEASQVDTTLSAEERPVGGLGILLVRELMDSVNYERVNGKNILTLCKEMENKKVIN